MKRDVYVIGVGMHPFGPAVVSPPDMGFVAAVAALEDAGIGFEQVGALYNGYLGGGLTAGVTMVKDLGLTGVPVTHVENASATGSTAFREAVQAVAGGACEAAMAIGFDDMNSLHGIGGSGPRLDGVILPAAFFAMWAVRRMHDLGTTRETFAAIAAKNWNHARTNPNAQRQADHEVTIEEVLSSTMISYPHTSKMACAAGAGGAAAIVASAQVANRLGERSRSVLVSASQQKSEEYTEGHVFLGAVIGPEEMTTATAQAAYDEAGLGPSELDLVQVHDAFPIEELSYYELLGICGRGDGDGLVWDGATSLGGRIPFSTDGGLTAGASGRANGARSDP